MTIILVISKEHVFTSLDHVYIANNALNFDWTV